MGEERVLVVEDDQAIAQGLVYQLQSERFRVYQAENGQDALKSLRTDDVHIVLLDIRLPDANGFDICRSIREEGRKIPIIILSALDSESDRVLGLELGADDYIPKPYKLKEVVARIRSVLRRAYGSLAPTSTLKHLSFGEIRIDLASHRIYRSDTIVALTPSEFQIACILAMNPDRVFSRAQLIQEIYGETRILDERSVDVHVHHLRSKLESDPRHPRWFTTVHGFGYCFSSK